MKPQFKYFLSCTVLFLAKGESFCQQNYVDSLKNVLEKTSADTSRIDLLNDLADEFAFSDYDKAADYAKQALDLSQKINSKSRIVRSYLKLGMIARERGDYDKAIPYLLSAMKISEEIDFKFGIGASASTIGTIYHIQGNYEKALEYLNASLSIAKEINSVTGMAASYSNIGQIYQEIGDCEKALHHYIESFKMDSALNEPHNVGLGFNNIGVAYSMKCTDKGFPDNKKAFEYFEKALDVFSKIDDRQGMAMCFNNISGVYLDKKDFPAAIASVEKGLAIAKEVGSKVDLKDAYENLSIAYDGMGDFKKAYEFHKLYSEMKDSLLNEES